jgi:hypothetical protein
MPRLKQIGTACLGAALLLGGCSGSDFYRRTDTEAGSSIIYDQSVLRTIERIIAICGDPVLQPGSDHFRGDDFFLGNCRFHGPSRDFTALVDGQPRPDRLQRTAILLGGIDTTLARPIPRNLTGYSVRRQAKLLTWLIPAFDNELNQDKIPRQVRAMLRATVRALLAGPQCEFVARVAVRLRPLHLTGVGLSWNRVQGAAILRLHTRFAEAAPQARARLTSSITCLGSTHNLANSLLHSFLPDGSHDVNLSGVDLTVDYRISVALPAAGQTTNTLNVTLRDISVAIGSVDIEPFGNPVGDSVMDNALKEANVTPFTLARRIEDQLRTALAPLGDQLAPILLDSLDLAATPDRPAREVVGVEAEASGNANEDQIRFEARRTDKICFMIPNVGLTCVDPMPDKPNQHCYNVPNIGEVCTPIVPPRP